METLVKILDALTQEYVIVNPFKKANISVVPVKKTIKQSLTWLECDGLLSQLTTI